MKLSHTRAAMAAVFDDPNLVSCAGLVPVLAPANAARPAALAGAHLSVPGDKGANAGLKVASLVAGMVAGVDSIEDMALPWQGRDGPGLRPGLRALDAGVVATRVRLRSRPAGSTRSPRGSLPT